MPRGSWPTEAELRSIGRLLCRPAPPLVPVATLHASDSLTAFVDRHTTGDDAATAARLAAALAEWRRTSSGSLVTFWDDEYPELLRHIARPPVVLFVAGQVEVLRRPAVAIVGARAASRTACDWTRTTAGDLARCGLVVVSGLARGIDRAAHEGALDAGGTTIAVLGCGPDRCYPPENAPLAARLRSRGCLVSEFPPGTPPRRWHFPQRNRILSGLSSGVVVVQAERTSGALVTARFALEENRQVMAVPGEVGDPRSRGPHALLRQGAALVDGAADVLEALGFAARAPDPVGGVAALPPVSGDGGAALAALGRGCPIETLRERLGWPPARLQAALAVLELAGLVHAERGGFVAPGR